MKLSVEVKPDHIKKLTSRDPVRAISELVWNALDADATEVDVEIEGDSAEGIAELVVRDNGHGMSLTEAERGFSSLGGPWKGRASQTRNFASMLHGKEGKGRFKAFALGSPVEWLTTYKDNGSLKTFRIVGDARQIDEFDLGEPDTCYGVCTGTEVKIFNVDGGRKDLRSENARNELIQLLAPYLASYPNIRVTYDGVLLDLDVVTQLHEELDLSPVSLEDGSEVEADLTVRLWTFNNERKIALCNAKGFTLSEAQAGRAVRAPGFNFTAYLASDYFDSFHDAGSLQMSEMFAEDEGVTKLIAAARKRLTAFFREMMAAQTARLVDEWRDQKIYPFTSEPANNVETAERQVFDIMALNVNQYLPDFEEMESEAKALIFECLRVAIDSGEEAARRILGRITKIPKKTQQELLELFDKTDVIPMIEATKAVTSRLEFLAGLRSVLFEAGGYHIFIDESGDHGSATAIGRRASDFFLIYHEYAHIIHGDVFEDDPQRITNRTDPCIADQEALANGYAAEKTMPHVPSSRRNALEHNVRLHAWVRPSDPAYTQLAADRSV